MSQLFLPFDTETGGFNEKKADLLTFYMAVMDESFTLLDELDLKLKPDGGRFPIAEAGALAVNKINIAEHMANPATVTYSEGKAKLVAMLKKHLKKNGRYSNLTVLGYNVPFDERWTQEYLLEKDEWLFLIHYKSLDVMQNVDFLKHAKWFPKDLGNLESVVDYLGLPKRGAHNAKEDTLMAVDVHKRIMSIMESKKDGGGGGSTQDLISL